MKILRLAGENFKRLTAVDITPDQTCCQITGKNSNGKSSVLDLISWIIGGPKFAPKSVIRNGAKSAKGIIDLGDFTVERKIGEGKESLILRNQDGKTQTAAQTKLDKLFSKYIFDPSAFARMKESEQAAILRKVTGLDTTELDDKRKQLYDERTLVNREVDSLNSQLKSMVVPETPKDIGEEKDLVAINNERINIVQHMNDNGRLRERMKELESMTKRGQSEVDRLTSELDAAIRNLGDCKNALAEVQEQVAAIVIPSFAEVDAKIQEAKLHNQAVRAKQNQANAAEQARKAKLEVASRAAAKEKASESLTKQINEIDTEKKCMLEEAKFPVPGLSVDGDTVLFNEIPISQVSKSEQIRIGCAVAVALNPELRVVMIYDGSLLDAETQQAVQEWAAENDVQVFMELVESDGPGCVVIEDGAVVEREVLAAV